jgi:phosphoserine phosphatase RsbU/P
MTVPHDPVLAEESAEELYEDAPCGYLSCYPDGRIARVNRTFLEWTGYDRGALVGAKRFVDLLSGGGRIYHETHYLPLLRMQGEVRAIAVDVICADGSAMPVLINSRLHRDAEGREVAIRTTVFDARDRKAYETELLAARRRADRLADEQRQVAVTLQTSMLPETLPSDPRLQLSAHYRPGVEGLEVGGDWYDAFTLDGDRVAVVVGDVVGRGLSAAAAMGQLRSAVRALATTDAGPASLLEHLDRFVDGFPAAQTATLAYAELDLRDGRVRYACAGHPPPVVVDPDGRPALLWGGRSAPLGAQILTSTRDEATVDLAPGSRLALYTDGLVERRDQPLDDRIDGLAAALGALARRPVAHYAEDVTEQVLADVDVVDDDVCLLALAYRSHGRGAASGG